MFRGLCSDSPEVVRFPEYEYRSLVCVCVCVCLWLSYILCSLCSRRLGRTVQRTQRIWRRSLNMSSGPSTKLRSWRLGFQWAGEFSTHTRTHARTHTHTHTHTQTHRHAHTHTHTVWHMLFTGTLRRRNGFYTVQAVCAIALHLNLALTGDGAFWDLKKNTIY